MGCHGKNLRPTLPHRLRDRLPRLVSSHLKPSSQWAQSLPRPWPVVLWLSGPEGKTRAKTHS